MSTDQGRSQRVIFLRHGVAQHNFHGADLHSPALADPSLTYEGKLGAVQAGERVRQWLRRHEERIELVVCSPLTRTLQTATLAFLPGDEYNHPVPIVCVENVREAFGMHTPDKRREKSLLMKHWPGVVFEKDMSGADVNWSPVQRETRDALARRVGSFLTWLCQRPEHTVVVVSHGVWIETCLAGALGSQRVYNCDAYATTLHSQNGKLSRLSDTKLVT